MPITEKHFPHRSFENPYVDVEKAKSTVGNPEFMKKGYEQQLRSIVMLKNSGKTAPISKIKES